MHCTDYGDVGDPWYGGGYVMSWLEAGPHSIGLPHDLSYLDPNMKDGLSHTVYTQYIDKFTYN